jgi:hypothetical protein
VITVYIACFNINPLMPSGYVVYYQVNIQQVYILPTEYIYVFFYRPQEQSNFCAIGL